MKRTRGALVGTILALSLGLAASGRAQGPGGNTTAHPPPGQAQNGGGKQWSEGARTNRPEVDKQRKEAQQEARRRIDQEAAAAIDETRRALSAIGDDNPDVALSAIESATGKISVLLARNPHAALIPAAAEVEVIDAAPEDTKAIRDLSHAVERAVGDRNYPAARAPLFALTSEIRVRT
jgi:hypothetical protein